MIIDLILDRKDGTPYSPREMYNRVSRYGPIGVDIARALDGGTEEQVKAALCEHILANEYNPDICNYINNVDWIDGPIKAIGCMFWAGPDTWREQLTAAEIVSLRTEYHSAAYKALKATGVDHVVYYRDTRDQEDIIIEAHFYVDMAPMTDSMFYMFSENYNGFIGAVHALR